MFKQKNNLKSLTLIDFGMSSFIDSKDYLYKKCGTYGMLAPEVLQTDQVINKKSDIYSLGILFFILLTGETLFKGKKKDVILLNNKEGNFNLT